MFFTFKGPKQTFLSSPCKKWTVTAWLQRDQTIRLRVQAWKQLPLESISALTSSCISLLADIPGSSSAGSSLVYLPPIITESALSPCLAGSCLPQHRENVNFGPACSSFLRFLLTSHGLRLLRHYYSHPVWMIFHSWGAQSTAAASLGTPP